MTQRYPGPPPNIRSLRDRLAQSAKREGVIFGRLQRHIAILVVSHYLAALTDERGEPLILVKGGTLLEIRMGIPDSRSSKDLDAVCREDAETAHERLMVAAEEVWQGFHVIFTKPEPFEVSGLLAAPHRFVAKISYEGKRFTSVPIEISPVEVGNAKHHDLIQVTAFPLVGLVDGAAVPCMGLRWQIAQKLHACTEALPPPRGNSRAHDLVDLQLLEALTGDSDLAATKRACLEVFESRRLQSWPPRIAPHSNWDSIYENALAGLEHLKLAPTLPEAIVKVQAFVARIDEITL